MATAVFPTAVGPAITTTVLRFVIYCTKKPCAFVPQGFKNRLIQFKTLLQHCLFPHHGHYSFRSLLLLLLQSLRHLLTDRIFLPHRQTFHPTGFWFHTDWAVCLPCAPGPGT